MREGRLLPSDRGILAGVGACNKLAGVKGVRGLKRGRWGEALQEIKKGLGDVCVVTLPMSQKTPYSCRLRPSETRFRGNTSPREPSFLEERHPTDVALSRKTPYRCRTMISLRALLDKALKHSRLLLRVPKAPDRRYFEQKATISHNGLSPGACSNAPSRKSLYIYKGYPFSSTISHYGEALTFGGRCAIWRYVTGSATTACSSRR